MSDDSGFTELQLQRGKESFDEFVASWRDARESLHPTLARSVIWRVAYVDSLFAEIERLRVRAGIADRLAEALLNLHESTSKAAAGDGVGAMWRGIDAAREDAAALLAEWAATGGDT